MADKAAGTLRRAADTDTVTKWDLTVKVGSRVSSAGRDALQGSWAGAGPGPDPRTVPQQVQKLLREICEAIGAKMVSQSSPDDQAHAEADHDAEPAAERQSPPPERRSRRPPTPSPGAPTAPVSDRRWSRCARAPGVNFRAALRR